MPNFKVIQDQPEEAKIQIFGTDPNTAVKTATDGTLSVTFADVTTMLSFTETSFADLALAIGASLNVTAQNVANFDKWTWVCSVTSTGGATPQVTMQCSPDNVLWINDGSATTITLANPAIMRVPNTFLKYSRLYFSNTTTAATLNLWFNAQS
ncbi:MAG: hypothetical protein H7X79_02580 [Sporomusaceae bacterium]|nr:hypothetical protein [Sporomusaceae bacterium]